jgi:decaprenylphospho-beta-D-erythro-pentofuranosid-2-ulose 2-reductase
VSSALVVGATTGVGRGIARALAKRGVDLMLVARTERDLRATAADMEVRFGIRAHWLVADIAAPGFEPDDLLERCKSLLGDVASVFVPAGAVSDEDCGPNPDIVAPIAAVNFLGPARIAATFGRAMRSRGAGQVILFSSIAAAAPRGRNVAYSAAKAALEIYARGLRKELEPKGVRLAVIALGYVDTRLSFGMNLRFPVADPDAVGEYVVSRRLQGRCHYPRFWWWITFVLRHLPWPIYRRMPF